tara:strand:- start:1059 stop:1277 length:219 start_codon:yes stop_codon:yes gene_type:complete
MSKQETVKYTIKQDGTVTEEVIGAIGKQCLKATEGVEEELGNVVNRDFLPSFYQELDFQEVVEEFTHDSEGC